MHVLIIGCGYLGYRAALEFKRRGHTVGALTRSSQTARDWAPLWQAHIGDVMQPESLSTLPAADLCLYAVGYDRSGAHDKRNVYVTGLRNVLTEIGSRCPRLIYISSTSVYGQDHGEIVSEESPCEPISPGGRICLEAERVVRELYTSRFSEQRAAILRLAGIYGPGRLIARVSQFHAREPISGNPEAWLNLIHVHDAVQAVMKLAEQDFDSTTYLLSDEQPLRRREFYEALARRVSAPPPVFEVTDHSLGKRCDSSQIRREIALKLRYPSALDALLDPGMGLDAPG